MIQTPFVGYLPDAGWPDVLRVRVWSTPTQPEERFTLFRRAQEDDRAFWQRAQARAAETHRAHGYSRVIHVFCIYGHDAEPQETDEYRNALLRLRHTIQHSPDADEKVAAVRTMGQMYGWLPGELQ